MKRFVARILPAILLIAASIALAAEAENWPRFRGPNGQGISESTGIPVQFTMDDLAWSKDLGGTGHASPIVWENTVYVTAADKESGKRVLHAFRAADGEELWRHEFTLPAIFTTTFNSQATPTPTADAAGVYTLWYGEKGALVVAHDHAGKERWRREFGTFKLQHGPGASPIVHDGLVVITLEQEENTSGLRSFWYGLEADTGETRWELERAAGAKASSATACVYTDPSGEDFIVVPSFSHGICAVRPADGLVAWEEPKTMQARVVSSIVLADDLLVATCGTGSKGMQLVATRPATRDAAARVVHDIAERFVSYVPTGVYADGRLYLTHDLGDITCLDIKTFQPIWSERPAGKSLGSAILVEDRLYRMDLEGTVSCVRAGDTYELLGLSPLGEATQATPAVANGRMFLRTASKLHCLAGASAR